MRNYRSIACVLVALGVAAPALAQAESRPAAATQPAEQGHKPAPYQRIDSESPDRVALQMAVREFAPPREGMPKVYLAGAVHIGRPEFYAGLQEFLDAQDVVLFEGVKPPGSGDPALDLEREQSDDQKAKATGRRVRLIAMAAEKYRQGHDRYPKSMDELSEGSGRRIADLLRVGVRDAWDRPLIYEVRGEEAASFDVYSLGMDGEPGGDGAAKDIKYSDQKPLSKSEAGDRSEGIQQKLADALGVVFQLEAMDHDKPNWRNSDLAVDQIQARLEKSGGDADQLFSMLSGASFGAKLAGILLDLVASDPRTQVQLRMMMIETLSMADELLELAPGGMGKMMSVILDDRNDVVVRDLKKIIESESGADSVAIIYGAGHLPGIEIRLVEEMGFKPVADVWHTAMEADAKSAGMTSEQFARTRTLMSQMMKRQLENQKKAANRKRPPAKKTASENEPAPALDGRE